nr:MAG TPA: hypothetical protein [Caudoviricetes sp.]
MAWFDLTGFDSLCRYSMVGVFARKRCVDMILNSTLFDPDGKPYRPGKIF